MTGRSCRADPCRHHRTAAAARPGTQRRARRWCAAHRRCRPGARHGAGLARASGRRIVVEAAVVVGRAATHERTRDAARWLVRNTVLYVATGAWVLGRRWWEARTNARYERLMRAAEAAGDYERLTDWEQRAEQARERRHRRRMDWITAPLDVARAAAVLVMCGIGFLLGLGAVLAIAHRDAAWLLTPTQKAVDGIAWVVWLLGVIWLPAAVVRCRGWCWPGYGRSGGGTAACRAGPPRPAHGSTRR